ncbi:MAG TPA: conjugal transfer protein, partial [Streptosporangiaceae bacterium]|nr:conjugal transfer protein [Streptosporangiaceae bacterium]
DLAQGSGKQHRTAPGWRGAGGRWLVWTFRIVVWLVLLIIGYRGVTAIVLGETSSGGTPAPAASPASTFPSGLASAYALQFGQVYLNANPATANQRASQLAAFLPAGADSQLGWNGSGSLKLQSEQVADVAVQDANHAVVTLLARVNGNLMELGVPVYYAGGALAVTGEPAWLPAPPKAAVPTPTPPSSDEASQAELTKQLPAFFQAYASGDQATLGRFLAPGTTVTGLNGQLTFGSLAGVTVPAGGDTRHVIATVEWNVPGQASSVTASPPAQLEMSYALTIVNQGGTWYISAIGPSFQTAGSS